jgi:glycosyltransferase involved in cell wall biosynthesis
LLGNHANQFELLLIGPSADEVRKNLGPDAALLDALAGNVHFAGCLPHRQALAEMARVDFSILLRPNLRFAQAGFPTKLVESLALGVPVICNLTSDIGRYVHDGREGIIVRDSSPDAFAEGLRRVLAMTPAQRQDLRHQARRAAEACFDYRNWVDPLGKFIHEALGRQH